LFVVFLSWLSDLDFLSTGQEISWE